MQMQIGSITRVSCLSESASRSSRAIPLSKTLLIAGAWIIHVVLILLGKILVDVIPGMEQDTSWTIVNLGYIAVSAIVHSPRC